MNHLQLQKQINLAKYSTWRIGGPAEWLAQPTSIKEIQNLLYWSKNNNIACKVFGAGSNLLINDKGIEGLCICMRKLKGNQIDASTGIIEASSGDSLPMLSQLAAQSGLHGLEWAIGIPGTIGGAIAMNAGAQSHCIAEKVVSVKVISLKNGKKFELKQKDLNFSYRYSLLQEESLIVLSAKIRLKAGYDIGEIKGVTNKNLHHRTNTQPYDLPSCGSVFRNPEPLKAGKIIEDLGLKGFRLGGAEISKKHANFIINYRNASAEDINQLILLVQRKVKAELGISLQTEVKRLGF